jgi:hypothetical protein
MGNKVGPILYYCKRESLPPLRASSLMQTGRSGYGLRDVWDLPALQAKAFKCDWYAIEPPAKEDGGGLRGVGPLFGLTPLATFRRKIENIMLAI